MFSHERIWAAIDRLAETHNLTPSGLAKRAGLDSTTFNKSKRFSADGRARWPSTESLAKIMDATSTPLGAFMAYVNESDAPDYRQLPALTGGFAEERQVRPLPPRLADIPVLGMAQAGAGGYFDDAGFPAGEGWDSVQFPVPDGAEQVYALEVSGDSMLPLYREGDVIIVSPGAQVRRGDRVVAKTRDGEVMAKILKKRNSMTIELGSANPEHPDRVFAASDIEWLARILWASQ